VRDVLVAGGGPVGLASALYAARAGLDVAVHDPRTEPVDKACGEGLMPGAVADLTALGVRLDGHPIEGIRYLRGSSVATARFHRGTGRGVRRTTLQRAMSEVVTAAGVTIEPRAVVDVRQCGDHLLVDGEPTRYLIAADGLHSPTRRAADLDGAPSGLRRYGLRCHLPIAPWASTVDVHWSSSAEAYVTPVGPDLVGVAILSDRPRPFEEMLLEFPRLHARVDGVSRTRVRGAGPLRQRSRQRTAGRILLVGDAAGYVDALTGEGIALGLAQARAAVDAVRRDQPLAYERDWHRLGRRHVLLTKALLAASRQPRLREHIVPAASRFPMVFEAAVNQLARPA
jgi:flavin-dependent dehydrogenase